MGETAWKMVPVEPTIRMLEAAWSADDAFHTTGRAHVWKAMLAAAPEPPAPSPVEEWQDISTAPKDGTRLLCVEYDEPTKVVDLHWYNDGVNGSWRGSFGQYRRPIYWRPLPSPPTQEPTP